MTTIPGPTIRSVGAKEFGITRLPTGQQKLQGIPELDNDELTKHIELYGARMAWSRSCFCPCDPVNDQTSQPDPNCAKCDGRGFFYFGPKNYVPPAEAGDLTMLQKMILADTPGGGAAVIRVLTTRSTQNQNPYDLIGNWVRGSMFATVRRENRIGYYDRFVNLDAQLSFSETIKVTDFTLPIRTRYRAVCVNNVETLDARFEQDIHFILDNQGRLIWLDAANTAPTPNNPDDPDQTFVSVAVHYDMHPTWLLIEHPHVTRESPKRRKIKVKKTPLGDPQQLPLQGMVQLEWLAGTRTSVPDQGQL